MRLLPFKIPAITPLLLNGYALVLNVSVTAILGIVFWMVATRLYSKEQVGIAAALISSMTTISYFSKMNLNSFLTRFIPEAKADAGRLIAKTYVLTGVLSGIAALAFAAGVGFIAEPLEVVRNDIALLVVFVTATVLWTIFALQDAALSGLRRSTLVPASNTVYAVAKIAFLFVPLAFSLSSDLGIFFAWTVPLLPIVVAVNVLIYQGLGRQAPEQPGRGIDLRNASRFWGWDFTGTLAMGAAFGIAPLMVTASAGVEATAAYHLAWSAAYSIYLVGQAMGTSLVAEGAADPTRLRRLIVDSLSHVILLVSGIVVFALVFAPQIMALFGPDYIEDGTPTLRLLVLSCLPWSVTTIFCAVARVRQRTRSVAIVQISTLLIFTAVSALLVGSHGAEGVAMGWLVAHSSLCVGLMIRVVLREGWIGFADWMLSMASSGRRLASLLPRPSVPSRAKEPSIPPAVMEGLEQSSLKGLAPIRVKGGLTDVTVLLYGDQTATDEARLILKFSSTENGIAALRRNCSALRTLAGDLRLGPHVDLLPKIVFEERWGEFLCTAETAVKGTEGRLVLHKGKGMGANMTSVVTTLADMHRRTAKARLIDDAWAKDWIDAPIEKVASFCHQYGGAKAKALARLRAELHETFVGRDMLLGLGHGDIWPGNLFFNPSQDHPEEGKLRLSGLVDWDTCRHDAPGAVDVCQFGLSVRMEQNGEEFGVVVRDILRERHWTEKEATLFSAAGFQAEFGKDNDPSLSRGILLLTWLHHVAMVIGQSKNGNWRRFWTFVNVDLVLLALSREPRLGAG